MVEAKETKESENMLNRIVTANLKRNELRAFHFYAPAVQRAVTLWAVWGNLFTGRIVMSKDIVIFILQYKGWLKSKGIRPKRWRKTIAGDFCKSAKFTDLQNKADEFIKTWEEMEKEGML